MDWPAQKYENIFRRNFDRFPETKLALLVSHFSNANTNTDMVTNTNMTLCYVNICQNCSKLNSKNVLIFAGEV